MAPYHGLTRTMTGKPASSATLERRSGSSAERTRRLLAVTASAAVADAHRALPLAAAQPAAATVAAITPKRALLLAARAADADIASTPNTCGALPLVARAAVAEDATRRALLLGAASSAAALLLPPSAQAIQGLTAGRIPGLSTTPDADGYVAYRRPEGKSGGHGVGWSEVPRYGFRVPLGWEEVPVSIADLGGTEIDARFAPPDGTVGLSVVVAPIARFLDIPNNSDLRLPDVGPPEKLMAGFYPELFGKTMDEGDILDTQVVTKKPSNATSTTTPLTYYFFELAKKRRVAITATGNRVFILSLFPKSSVGGRKHGDDFKRIAESFEVDAAKP